MSRLETRVPLADAPRPGEVRVIELGGHRVGLFQVNEELYALADRCPHRGAPLCSSGRTVRGVTLLDGVPTQGALASFVRCPWHKWDFDITTGQCLVHPRLRVRGYQVTVEHDEIVITANHPSPGPRSRGARWRVPDADATAHDASSTDSVCHRPYDRSEPGRA